MDIRETTLERRTSETEILLNLTIDGNGESRIETGIGFFDHMLVSLARHARFDLKLTCKGDLEVDDHHTIEDCGLALGQAIDSCLGDRRGIERFASAYAPLDEALARVVIDFSGRPGAFVALGFVRENIGAAASENLSHFFQSLAMTARMTLHADMIKGENDHHRAEAAFKALALALRTAVRRTGETVIPSTKGTL